jgi:hypothetical protein
MDNVPSDLDTSSARLTQEEAYKVSYLPSPSAIPMNTLHTGRLKSPRQTGGGSIAPSSPWTATCSSTATACPHSRG